MTPAEDVVVRTTLGRLRGTKESGLTMFRGVPYAAPPVGELRWRDAAPHPGWTGTRDAKEHGPIAPQRSDLPHYAVFGSTGGDFESMDEDCLTLTIATPEADARRRPVLVWIHGGGNVSGAGSWDWYDGRSFCRDGDLVFVSINYRLGPLGYLYMGEEDGTAHGNFWLSDMLAALRWVRDNIAAFGGDPDTVTVAGESGGAASIAWMMGVAEARGLFRRAILQSAPLGVGAIPPAEAAVLTERYLHALGASTAAEARRLPWERLLEPVKVLTETLMPPFSAVLDHPIQRPRGEALTGDIDVLIGWTREEHGFFLAPDPQMRAIDEEQVIAALRLQFGEAAPEAYAEYARMRPGARPVQVLIDACDDECFRIDAMRFADANADRGGGTYAYQLDWASPAFEGLLGAAHCMDVPFAFDNFHAWRDSALLQGNETHQRGALAKSMHRAWIDFTRTGDPGHQGLPDWAPYTTARRTVMRLDAICEPMDDPGAHRRRLWERLGGRSHRAELLWRDAVTVG
ncbi:carboxylesterase family protein [Actinomadura fulvescens]|uniref:Carboxylic ester hydrolase n=1 Tax=Actinomadura fulvescens TaxID=46160 RepID=A0ABN3PLL4_9ACTN